jgi:hypothetical protein
MRIQKGCVLGFVQAQAEIRMLGLEVGRTWAFSHKSLFEVLRLSDTCCCQKPDEHRCTP